MTTCSKCGGPADRWPQRYCTSCHAAYMRANRTRHSHLSQLARKKANCRAYTNVLVRRGKIDREPCEKCGDPRAQAHHVDYDDPWLVFWLCRPCHLAEHA